MRAAQVRAVMPVHLYGQCADMDRFGELAQEYDAVASSKMRRRPSARRGSGKKAGTLGNAAGFSFYPTKNLSAYGDGGCVTTDDEELADHVRRLRNHGSRQRYYHEEIGWNSRLDAMQAAMLRVKLKHIDDWNQRRRMVACRYHGLFVGCGPGASRRAVGQCAGAHRAAGDACLRPTTSTTSLWCVLFGAMNCGTS